VVGAVLAVLAFATAAGLASLSLVPGNTGGKRVVVAKNDISARNKIQASDLQLSVVNPEPKFAFYDIAAVAGKSARVDIPALSPVTANLIAGASDLLSTSEVAFLPIPAGYVAVTVATGELVGVGGYPQVGDRITMLATINTTTFGSLPGAQVVRTAFRDVYIIKVGPVNQSSGTAQVASSLTLLMTACDAEYLFWLTNNATLKFTLESSKDYATSPVPADPACTKAGGVGPKEVNKRWQFTGP
jgi:pilus assembly protein CpaB